MDFKNYDLTTHCSQETHFIQIPRLVESETMEKTYSMQIEPKENRDVFNIRQTDFKSKKFTKDKEGHFMLIKVSIQQEDIMSYKHLHIK